METTKEFPFRVKIADVVFFARTACWTLPTWQNAEGLLRRQPLSQKAASTASPLQAG